MGIYGRIKNASRSQTVERRRFVPKARRNASEVASKSMAMRVGNAWNPPLVSPNSDTDQPELSNSHVFQVTGGYSAEYGQALPSALGTSHQDLST